MTHTHKHGMLSTKPMTKPSTSNLPKAEKCGQMFHQLQQIGRRDNIATKHCPLSSELVLSCLQSPSLVQELERWWKATASTSLSGTDHIDYEAYRLLYKRLVCAHRAMQQSLIPSALTIEEEGEHNEDAMVEIDWPHDQEWIGKREYFNYSLCELVIAWGVQEQTPTAVESLLRKLYDFAFVYHDKEDGLGISNTGNANATTKKLEHPSSNMLNSDITTSLDIDRSKKNNKTFTEKREKSKRFTKTGTKQQLMENNESSQDISLPTEGRRIDGFSNEIIEIKEARKPSSSSLTREKTMPRSLSIHSHMGSHSQNRSSTLVKKISHVRKFCRSSNYSGNEKTGGVNGKGINENQTPTLEDSTALPTQIQEGNEKEQAENDLSNHFFSIETRLELKERLVHVQKQLSSLLVQTKLAWMKCFSHSAASLTCGENGEVLVSCPQQAMESANSLVIEGEELTALLHLVFSKAASTSNCSIDELQQLVECAEKQLKAFQKLVETIAHSSFLPSPSASSFTSLPNDTNNRHSTQPTLTASCSKSPSKSEAVVYLRHPVSFDLPSMKAYCAKVAPPVASYLHKHK